jgi:hypothetical protein
MDTVIHLERPAAQEGSEATKFTDITIVHATGTSAIHDLVAAEYVSDETGELRGIKPPKRYFRLGDPEDSLSLFYVMREVTLAAHTVIRANTQDYLSAADPIHQASSFPKTF